MTIQLDAVFHDGVLHLKQPVPLANGTEVHVVIETSEVADDPLAEVIGIGDGPPDGDVADRHDHYVYGVPQ